MSNNDDDDDQDFADTSVLNTSVLSDKGGDITSRASAKVDFNVIGASSSSYDVNKISVTLEPMELDLEGSNPQMDRSTNQYQPTSTNIDQSKVKTSGIFAASFNFINSIVGAGIIGMPYAMKRCGFFAGLFLLPFVGYLTKTSVQKLITCGVRVGKFDYEELAHHTLGNIGYYIITIAMMVSGYVACVIYFIVIGDCFGDVVEGSIRTVNILIPAVLICLPLSLLKDMSSLSKSSSLSILADVILVCIIVFAGPKVASDEKIVFEENNDSFALIRPSIFAGLGTMSFAFVCQHSTFIVYKSLTKPTKPRWDKTVNISVGTSLTLCMIMACAGYLSFLDQTNADILNNFPKSIVSDIGRFLLAVTMFFTFPMEHFVARQCLYALIYKKDVSEMPDKTRYIMTLCIWGSALIISLLTSNLGLVLELSGSVLASSLAYILPGVIDLKQREKEFLRVLSIVFGKKDKSTTITVKEKYTLLKPFVSSMFFVFFGVLAMMCGVITQILTYESEESHSNHEH